MSTPKSPNPKIGNADLADKLAAFDYKKLTGDAWNNYLDLTIGKLTNPKSKIESRKNPRQGGLAVNDLYDYEGYKVTALVEHLDPDDETSKTVIVGIKLRESEPLHNTRITAGRAKTMNAQIANFTGREPGIYYLLKKVEPEAEAAEATKRAYTSRK